MFKVGDKVRRKKEHLIRNNWPHGQKVVVVTCVNNNGLMTFAGENPDFPYWDTTHFELVEGPAEPVVPGIPYGYRLVRIGTPEIGEYTVTGNGGVMRIEEDCCMKYYVIIEPLAPKTKKVKMWQYMTMLLGETGWCMCTHREVSPGPSWVEVPGSEIEVEVPDDVCK